MIAVVRYVVTFVMMMMNITNTVMAMENVNVTDHGHILILRNDHGVNQRYLVMAKATSGDDNDEIYEMRMMILDEVVVYGNVAKIVPDVTSMKH